VNETGGESVEASAPERGSSSDPIPDNLARDMDRDELSRLVREVNDAGVSYQQMADRAKASGHTLSKPYFQKMATNAVIAAPTPDRLRALAAGLGKPLSVVQRAAAVQYLEYQATELAGYDEDVRVIVAHLAGMEKGERRRWQAMIEAAERSKRDDG
jgi:endonuclease/exonuclease/phosphatase family metal-dependent hydrolase